MLCGQTAMMQVQYFYSCVRQQRASVTCIAYFLYLPSSRSISGWSLGTVNSSSCFQSPPEICRTHVQQSMWHANITLMPSWQLVNAAACFDLQHVCRPSKWCQHSAAGGQTRTTTHATAPGAAAATLAAAASCCCCRWRLTSSSA